MRKTLMTGRERVNRMFARQDQDCVPRHESYWSDTIDRWRNEGLQGDANDLLGSDFHGVSWVDTFPFPGSSELITEDEETRTIRDEWGNVLRYWKHRMGTPEHVSFGCRTREDWETIYKPALMAVPNWIDYHGVARASAHGRRQGRWVHLTGLETFENTRRLMGDEIILMAMIEDPEWVVDVSNTLTDLTLREFQRALDAGADVDGVWIYGDMAYRSGVLCGPPLYRELIWPDHKKMADWAHERGFKFIFHTDGDVNAVVPDYIRAGFDCLQPLEAKAGMDVTKLCPQYGDKLAFFGNCDVMIYATNDRDAIEEELRRKVGAGMAAKGYVYHSDHSVPPSVSWETYQFIIDALDRIGNYA